jgi:hypothetical protein
MIKSYFKQCSPLRISIELIYFGLFWSIFWVRPLQAQHVPQTVINGIFTPNSSELFFQEGRDKLDREIEFLYDRRLTANQNLLRISDELIKQQQELENQSKFDILPVLTPSNQNIDFEPSP